MKRITELYTAADGAFNSPPGPPTPKTRIRSPKIKPQDIYHIKKIIREYVERTRALTGPEAQGIEHYAGDSKNVNSYLRRDTPLSKELVRRRAESGRTHALGIQTAIKAHVVQTPMTLWRGARVPDEELVRLHQHVGTKKVLRTKGIISTSTSAPAARFFSAKYGGPDAKNRVIYRIHAPAGTHALDVNQHYSDTGGDAYHQSGEREHLLPHGARFTVKKIETKTYVHPEHKFKYEAHVVHLHYHGL